MQSSLRRNKVYFESSASECAAWHYPGTNGGCVVMAGGLGVTKEPATDLFAARFNDAGFSVLAFDFRGLGESGGRPRQVARIGEQQADWQAAIDFAATLAEVDRARIAIWGFSLSGGHVFRLASLNPQLAGAIAHSALADGRAATPNALRNQTPWATLRLTARAALDLLGGVVGRDPLLVPLAAPRGTVATLSTPDSLNGEKALNPGNRYPNWQKQIAARSALRLGFYRPARYASKIGCPLLVLAYEHDGVSPPRPSIRAGEGAPKGKVVKLPGGHYEAFLDGYETVASAMLDFLREHVGGAPGPVETSTRRARARTAQPSRA
jgi:pimeloyl-ACP methyl ester carboxylesterase